MNQTMDYSKFSFADGNRGISESHVSSLVASIKKNGYLNAPIIVNSSFQVIDGQHRFVACVRLKEPIRYVVHKDYGLNEVRVLNQNQKNWTLMDFVKSGVVLGDENMIQLMAVKKRFPKIPISSLVVFTGSPSALHANGGHGGRRVRDNTYRYHDNRIPFIQKINTIAEAISVNKDFAFGTRSLAGLSTVVMLDGFVMQTMLDRVAAYPYKIEKCGSVTGYHDMYRNLYNYHTREYNKI